MPSLPTPMRCTWMLLLPLLALGCRSHAGEIHQLFGPTYVDSSGIDLVSATPIEIEGERNRIRVAIPASLHPNYRLLKIVDSTDTVPTEFVAVVELSSGSRYTFRARGLNGVPGYPEQLLTLEPADSFAASGKVVRINLRSTRPVIIPHIEWQSWSQGL